MRRILGTMGTACAGYVAINFYYRPLPDDSIDSPNGGNTPRTAYPAFVSSKSLAEFGSDPPLVVNVARRISTFITVSVMRLIVFGTGKFEVIVDENYVSFLQMVLSRRHKQPLITVSNHRSMVDDPGMMSCILPYFMSIKPQYLRWSLCSQEFCFSHKLPEIFHGQCGSFKVLPIQRGAGVNQRLFRDFARLCFEGEWVHLFPEGGVWQLDVLGGRHEEMKRQAIIAAKEHQQQQQQPQAEQYRESVVSRTDKGKLKWGVGKLIAHSAVTPLVVPFHMAGTETIIPQDPVSKKPLTTLPITGHNVKILFGEAIGFEDIIHSHEAVHGAVRKMDGKFENKEFISLPHEYDLYEKITRRIEERMEGLQQKGNGLLST